METDIRLIILTPQNKFFDNPVNSVVVPAEKGRLGILKGHAPLISTLTAGKLTIKDAKGVKTTLEIKDGFVEIHDNTVTVLTEGVEASTAAESPEKSSH